MRSLISDPFLLSAIVIVVGWFAGGLNTLVKKMRALTGALTAFTATLSAPAGAVSENDLDSRIPGGSSELPIVWRRIKAAKFVSVDGRTALSNEPADLVAPEDLLDATKWYRFCSATPNYLVGIGLGLTFLGLVRALASIDAQNLSDPAQLTQLFAAMKFKFIASMLGIFTSIAFSLVLRTYVSAVHHHVGEFQAALATRYPVVDPVVDAIVGLGGRVTAVEHRVSESTPFVARTAAASEQSLEIWGNVVDQLRTAATQLKKFNDELSISIGNVLEQRFEQKLLPPISDALKSLERAVNGVREAHTTADGEMMNGVINGFREAVSGGASAEVAAITATLTQLNESLSATQHDLQRVGKTIETNVVSGIQAAMTQLTQSIGTLNSQLAESVTSASGSLTSQLDTAATRARDSFSSVAARLDGLLQQANGAVASSTSSAQSTERVLDRFAQLVTKLEEAQIAFGLASEPIQRATARLETVADGIRQAAESIDRSAERSHAAGERVSVSWAQASERFEAVDKDLAAIFNGLNQGLTSYAATVNEFNGKLTSEFTKAIGSLQGIVGDLDDTLREMRTLSAGAGR